MSARREDSGRDCCEAQAPSLLLSEREA